MAAVSGFKCELTHQTGTTSLPGGFFLTHADGTVAALVGAVDPTKTVKVKLTLDPKMYLLKQVLIEGRVQPEDGPNAARLIKLSGFGEQIVIEKPV